MADQIINVNSGFYDSIDRDRLYSAEQMNMPYKRLIADGVFATPTGDPSTDLQVVFPAGLIAMAVTVKKGNAMIGGKWFESPTDMGVSVPSNSDAYARIDSIIAQVDNRTSGRVGSIVYRTGTPSSSPTPPPINEVSGVHELRLANITVAPGATAMSDSTISDTRGSSECPWVTALIQQVDTSELYRQWQDAYKTYFDNTERTVNAFILEQQKAWQAFFNAATHNFSAVSYFRYTSSYITSGSHTMSVPINIPVFDRYTDILCVYINGLMAAEGIRFNIAADGTSITLASALPEGQTVYFEVLHAVQPTDVETAISMINRIQQDDIAPMASDIDELQESVSELRTDVNALKSDTGWVTMELLNSYTAAGSNVPQYRKVGNVVYIRGAVCIVGNIPTAPICQLPAIVRPRTNHYYASIHAEPYETTSGTRNLMVEIAHASGYISVCAGSLTKTSADGDYIPLATSFLLG